MNYLCDLLIENGREGEAIGIDPDYYVIRATYAQRLFEPGRADEALREIREVVRLCPDSAIYRVSLGRYLLAMGDADGAIHEFREAIRLSPYAIGAHRDLARAYEAKGMSEEARAEEQEAEQLAKGDERGELPEDAIRSMYEEFKAAPGRRLQKK